MELAHVPLVSTAARAKRNAHLTVLLPSGVLNHLVSVTAVPMVVGEINVFKNAKKDVLASITHACKKLDTAQLAATTAGILNPVQNRVTPIAL